MEFYFEVPVCSIRYLLYSVHTVYSTLRYVSFHQCESGFAWTAFIGCQNEFESGRAKSCKKKK
jgi:hypothetical protein